MKFSISLVKEAKFNYEKFDDEKAEGDREQQVFEFVGAPPFVMLLTGSQVEPLYFVQVREKWVA